MERVREGPGARVLVRAALVTEGGMHGKSEFKLYGVLFPMHTGEEKLFWMVPLEACSNCANIFMGLPCSCQSSIVYLPEAFIPRDMVPEDSKTKRPSR